MLKIFAFLLICFSFSNLSASSAKDLKSKIEKNELVNKSQEKENKLYVNSNDVQIIGNRISLLHAGKEVPIKALYSDSKGIFVKKDKKDSMWPLPFICSRCGRANSGFNFVCEYCGEPRDD